MTPWKNGVWVKDGETLNGQWRYFSHADNFFIVLDAKCPITGKTIETETSNDDLSFNGWKYAGERLNADAR